MIYAGLDIGSLTAKGVFIDDRKILSTHIMKVRATAVDSASAVLDRLLFNSGFAEKDIKYFCTTGYGRLDIPFSDMNISEISCHGMGAYHADNSIRTIIDIGGQDCKVISIDETGLIKDFIMNDKCAAGTGRSLEILSKLIGVELESLGPLTLKSRAPLNITNKCSIFMELEVLDAMYRKKRLKHIAAGLSDAVAKRVSSLAESIEIQRNICLTGGVSKNKGVARLLEKRLKRKFKKLPIDPQIAGALGAAIFAKQSFKKNNQENHS